MDAVRMKIRIIATVCLFLIPITSCSPQNRQSKSDSASITEVPFMDLSDLWKNSDLDPSEKCSGTLSSSAESQNARVEIRNIGNGRDNLCILRKNSDNGWSKIAGTYLANHQYNVTGDPYENGYIDPGGSSVYWWECRDSTSILLDSPENDFGNILIAFRRTWECHGSAGGTYQQGLLTLFIDTSDPKALVRGLPALEILDSKQPSGTIFTSQYQFCAATGFCQNYRVASDEIISDESFSVSIFKKGEKLFVLDPTAKFTTPTNLELTLFDQRSLPCVDSDLCEGKVHTE